MAIAMKKESALSEIIVIICTPRAERGLERCSASGGLFAWGCNIVTRIWSEIALRLFWSSCACAFGDAATMRGRGRVVGRVSRAASPKRCAVDPKSTGRLIPASLGEGCLTPYAPNGGNNRSALALRKWWLALRGKVLEVTLDHGLLHHSARLLALASRLAGLRRFRL